MNGWTTSSVVAALAMHEKSYPLLVVGDTTDLVSSNLRALGFVLVEISEPYQCMDWECTSTCFIAGQEGTLQEKAMLRFPNHIRV